MKRCTLLCVVPPENISKMYVCMYMRIYVYTCIFCLTEGEEYQLVLRVNINGICSKPKQ